MTIASVIFFVLVVYSNSSQTSGTIVDNKQKTLSAITSLVSLSQNQQLIPNDFSELSDLVKNDTIASRQINYAIWFSENGITEHMAHKLGDLYNYLSRGKYEVCVPHEVEHLVDYIQFRDSEKLQETLTLIDQNYQIWLAEAYSLKQRFPTTYANLDQVIFAINSALLKIKNGNYQITSELAFINSYSELGCSGL